MRRKIKCFYTYSNRYLQKSFCIIFFPCCSSYRFRIIKISSASIIIISWTRIVHIARRSLCLHRSQLLRRFVFSRFPNVVLSLLTTLNSTCAVIIHLSSCLCSFYRCSSCIFTRIRLTVDELCIFTSRTRTIIAFLAPVVGILSLFTKSHWNARYTS